MLAVLAAGGLAPAVPATSVAEPSADVAALQTALRAVRTYTGTTDGVAGPATLTAVRAFQHRARLVVDGTAGPHTRRALGRRGRPAYGSRDLRPGARGWDVAALQFLLGTHGFPCGEVDGGYGWRVAAAVRRLQAWAGLVVDGVAGPAVRAVLRRAPPRAPYALAAPVAAPVSDRYGPRGARFHAGVDFPAGRGTPVVAAGAGTVTFAGATASGFGRLVVVTHAGGVATRYAHLARVEVEPGTAVTAGTLVGRVGATGHATGPHLHFEVLVRGANVDPLGALGAG